MTSKNRLVFTMEGLEQNDHHLDLSVFIEKTRQFLAVLNNSAEKSGKKGTVFRVVDLSHSSPATIACAPIDVNNTFDSVVFEHVMKDLDNTANDEKVDYLSNAVLSSMEKLADIDPKKITRAEIYAVADGDKGEGVYILDDRLRDVLVKARNVEEKVISSIDGKLEEINIHNEANTFKIYSSLPRTPPVACKFEKDLLETAQGALGRFVSVWGECTYRPDQAFPYKIDVQEMEVFPPSEELPSLRDLYGIAPNMTGGKTPEQFVREIRDEWSNET